jgi:hypothetical protein
LVREGEGCATDVNDNEGIETHKEVVFDAERLIRSPFDGTSVPQMDGVISNVNLHVKGAVGSARRVRVD